MAHEESAAHNKILRTVELEQEWLARLEQPEFTAPAWLPEVHLVRQEVAQKREPVAVSDTYPNLHCSMPSSWSWNGGGRVSATRASDTPCSASRQSPCNRTSWLPRTHACAPAASPCS